MSVWYKTTSSMGETIVIYVSEDYTISGYPDALPDYLAWIDEGNTPEPWEPES